jgi:hypothetical protein
MRLWWWRRVRRAQIPSEERDVLERYGETVVQLMLANGYGPSLDELPSIYYDKAKLANAAAWLTERNDENTYASNDQRQSSGRSLYSFSLKVVHDFRVGGYLSSGWRFLVTLARP